MDHPPAPAPHDHRPLPSIAVIVPAHRDSPELHRCLAALRACDPAADEFVVVVDGAARRVGASARAHGARVIDLQGIGGPARARNAGTLATSAEVVFFVDSDVEVPPDAVGRVRRYLGAHLDVDAIIGSYDAAPPARGTLSQYKNLLNHHMHQRARREATTFWGACGAIRREAFDAVGGFDEVYTRPSVEDIEFGYRLRAAGKNIHVVKSLQVTHLKRWTARGLLRADVLDRAVPWSELIVHREGFADDLNISRVQRVKVVAAIVVVLGVAGGGRSRWPRRGAGAAVALLAVLDAPLVRFFSRERGVPFAVLALSWHWWSYLYSAAAFGSVMARRLGRQGRGRAPG